MNGRVLYNEIDPFAAAWLRELITAGAISAGDVDERDIRDLRPCDLEAYEQCHFFAGIGGWSEALRLAGLSGMRGVWTGSCPCQPFSAAGKALGFADERHLWPAFFHLIDRCRPAIVMGEQVASKDGLAWLDLVHADLEGAGYAVRAVDTCAAGVGAPHIRQRLWFVGNRERQECELSAGSGATSGDLSNRARLTPPRRGELVCDAARPSGIGTTGFGRNATSDTAEHVADAAESRWGRQPIGTTKTDGWTPTQSRRLRDAGQLAERGREGRRQVGADAGGCAGSAGLPACKRDELPGAHRDDQGRAAEQPSGSPWADCEWPPCRDGKARPAQPGIQPLAHGIPNRVGTLRGAGNAIVPVQGAEVVMALL